VTATAESTFARVLLDQIRERMEARERRLAALEVTRRLSREARELRAEWRTRPGVTSVCEVLGRTLGVPSGRVLDCLALAESEDRLVLEQIRQMHEPAQPAPTRPNDAPTEAHDSNPLDPYDGADTWR
jgi:hypothetical protein